MELQIEQLHTRPPEMISELTDVWEASVRATHLFLSEEEIQRLRGYVPQALSSVAHLAVVRDEDGRYYPYDVLTSEATEDGAAWEESYILYGLEDPETLELLPAELEGGFVTVGLEDLPWQGEGGYTFASFTVEEGQMALRLEPDGVVGNTGYCGSIAYFLDGAGEKLFYGDGAPDVYQNSYTDWRDGSVTITWSLDEAAQAQAEGLAGLELYEEHYVPQEGTGVLLPLTK